MDLPDLFPGFKARTIDTGGARIFCRIGGDAAAAPVVLLHGYPQTHVMWHRIAPALAAKRRVVVADLRGYGWSSVPEDGEDHAGFSKRAMAADVVALMEALGHSRFDLVGHDRGARVAYRLALDAPGRVKRLALLDILPTAAMWSGMDAALAMKVYHWLFLAQPAPLPEALIGGAPANLYIDHTLASWTARRDLSAFHRGALAHYRAFFAVPDRLHATCEDYRAGAGIDRRLDEEDRAAGRTIDAPTLVLWGRSGIPARQEAATAEDGPLAAWRPWCRDLSGAPIDAGHFIAEENPEATLASLLPFLDAEAPDA